MAAGALAGRAARWLLLGGVAVGGSAALSALDVCREYPSLCRYKCPARTREGYKPPFPVVGVGWKRTGTTSLSTFLVSVGFAPQVPAVRDENIGVFNAYGVSRKHLIAVSQDCYAFEDYPWCCDVHLLAKMKEERPDARFVLTVRDPGAWWASVSRWVEARPDKRRVYEQLLNARPLTREAAVRAMDEHNARVRALFAGGADSHRLLEVNVEAEESSALARRLCAFLGMASLETGECRTLFPGRSPVAYDRGHAPSPGAAGGLGRRLLRRGDAITAADGGLAIARRALPGARAAADAPNATYPRARPAHTSEQLDRSRSRQAPHS